MTRLSLILFLCCSFSLCGTLVAQSSAADTLEEQYHACLDKGHNMLNCAQVYYMKTDSLLNLTYRSIITKCNDQQKAEFRKEQLAWLKHRDVYFKKTRAEFEKANPGKSPYSSAFGAQDDAMFMFDKNAAFVKKRILSLMRYRQPAHAR